MTRETVYRFDELDAFYRGDTAHTEGFRHTENPYTDSRLARAWDLGFRGETLRALKELS